MAIKAGQIIHVGNDTVVVDRIQTAGPGNVNIPIETIYELGNYKSIAQIRDTPDLSFSMESFDVSAEMEALLLGKTLGTATYPIDPTNARPIDMKSAFKAGLAAASPYNTVNSVGLPFLTLEQLSYRFGLRDNARQTATLRGDSIYYNPGSTYVEKTTGTNTANQSVVTAFPAYSITEAGVTRRILNVMAGTKRLVYGVDWTEAYGVVTAGAAVTTLTIVAAVPVTESIQIMYASPTVETFGTGVHTAVSTTRPAAIRGRDIAVYLGGYNAGTPYANRVLGVQAANLDWRVTLERDEEFGNYHAVAQDYDVPSVTGSLQIKPADSATLLALIQQITGTSAATKSAPATSSPVLELDIVLMSPDDGSVLKRLHVEDARLTVPGFQGRVQQKLDVTINFGSDTGALEISQT